MLINFLVSLVAGYFIVTVVLIFKQDWLQLKIISFLVSGLLLFFLGLDFIVNDTKTAIITLITVAVALALIIWIWAIILRLQMLRRARSGK